MRDPYYQDAGNPIQRDRLPKGKLPSIQFVAPIKPLSDIVRELACWFALMMFDGLLLLTLCPESGIAWFHPWDQFFGRCTLALFCSIAVIRFSLRPLMNPACLCAVVVLCLSSQTPKAILIQVAAASAGCLIYSFGYHGVVLKTAFPMPPTRAHLVRERYARELAVTAVVFSLLVYVELTYPSRLATCVLFTLPLICSIRFQRQRLRTNPFRLLWTAFIQWLFYDGRNVPGHVQSPTGSVAARLQATRVMAALTMVSMIRCHGDFLQCIRLLSHIETGRQLSMLTCERASSFTLFRYTFFFGAMFYCIISLIPVIITLFLLLSSTLPILQNAADAASEDPSDTALPHHHGDNRDHNQAAHVPLPSPKDSIQVTAFTNDAVSSDVTSDVAARLDAPESTPDVVDADPEADGCNVEDSYYHDDDDDDDSDRDAIWTREYEQLINCVFNSNDKTERRSVFLGRVLSDKSPVFAFRNLFLEHVHVLGDSGSGKTSLCLMPLIEQLVASGNCSVIVIDLKADSLELLGTLHRAAELAQRRRRIQLPVKHFSIEPDRSTFALNPMQQPFWSGRQLDAKVDLLLGTAGLLYGTDYGRGYYSSANFSVAREAMKSSPNSYVELVKSLESVFAAGATGSITEKMLNDGAVVVEVMKRLAAVEALNVTPSSGHSVDVVSQSIDLTRFFQRPQLAYFHLSSMLSPNGAPEVARLVCALLLAAAAKTKRTTPVFLVIDEFQRMVASNLAGMLQMARSMGVGVILANQSMSDLRVGSTDLRAAVEGNCRVKQWFSVSSREDQERLIATSGTVVNTKTSYSTSVNPRNEISESWATSEEVVPRLSLNDILLMNDHPKQSVLRIGRGKGYAQYGGMSVIIENDFHITPHEYKRRQQWPWPDELGAFVPCREPSSQVTPAPPPSPTPGIIVTEEVIDWEEESKPDSTPTPEQHDPFNDLKEDLRDKGQKRRRRPKS